MRVGQLSRYSQVLLLPLGAPRMPVLACPIRRLSQDSEVWRVLTTDVGNVTEGQGVPDHQALPISGAQDVQAFCQLFQGFTTLVVLGVLGVQAMLKRNLVWEDHPLVVTVLMIPWLLDLQQGLWLNQESGKGLAVGRSFQLGHMSLWHFEMAFYTTVRSIETNLRGKLNSGDPTHTRDSNAHCAKLPCPAIPLTCGACVLQPS